MVREQADMTERKVEGEKETDSKEWVHWVDVRGSVEREEGRRKER